MRLGSAVDRLRRWTEYARRVLTSVGEQALEAVGLLADDVDTHTRVTFRAAADAVVPETPELADELGPEHEPGALAVDLDEFFVEYVNRGFQFGLPYLGPQGNLELADPIALALDGAANALVDRGDNEAEPSVDRAVSLRTPDDPPAEEIEAAAGTFAELAPRDRLRAIALLGEVEFEETFFEDTLVEVDLGLVGNLVVGFMEMIYYSEWQGYEDFFRPPSERTHPNDPAAVQSWRQTDFPGFANGYAALRGYLGTEDGPLGGGDEWTSIDGDVGVYRQSGSFRDNDYDTSDYEEPFPVEGPGGDEEAA